MIPYFGPEMVEWFSQTQNFPKAASEPQPKHIATYKNESQPIPFLSMLSSLRYSKTLVVLVGLATRWLR